MRLSCFVGVTVVRREDAGGDDPDPLLGSLLAGMLPSKLSKSASARSPKGLLRRRASLEGSFGPGWTGVSGKGELGEETTGEGCGMEGRGKTVKSSERRRSPEGVPSAALRGSRCSHTARRRASLAF